MPSKSAANLIRWAKPYLPETPSGETVGVSTVPSFSALLPPAAVPLESAATRVLKFLATLNLQDHPVAEQKEFLAAFRELKGALQPRAKLGSKEKTELMKKGLDALGKIQAAAIGHSFTSEYLAQRQAAKARNFAADANPKGSGPLSLRKADQASLGIVAVGKKGERKIVAIKGSQLFRLEKKRLIDDKGGTAVRIHDFGGFSATHPHWKLTDYPWFRQQLLEGPLLAKNFTNQMFPGDAFATDLWLEVEFLQDSLLMADFDGTAYVGSVVR